MALLGFFKRSIGATVLAVGAAALYRGLGGAAVAAGLIALEASSSFDNAAVNAEFLRRMSERWQRAFLTIGIVIAVFELRVFFPIAVVALATSLGLVEVANQGARGPAGRDRAGAFAVKAHCGRGFWCAEGRVAAGCSSPPSS